MNQLLIAIAFFINTVFNLKISTTSIPNTTFEYAYTISYSKVLYLDPLDDVHKIWMFFLKNYSFRQNV